MSPDVNRALARELYVESTVNVVNPSAKNSPSKIKPGQMNLFNPKGKNNLPAFNGPIQARSSVANPSSYFNKDSERSVDKIQSIFNDGAGDKKLRNPDLQAKTAAI